MLTSLRYNLTRLIVFSGRESRAMFWPYAGMAGILAIAAIAAAVFPETNATLAQMQSFAQKHPELATIRSSQTSYSITIHGRHPELFTGINSMIVKMNVVLVVLSLLIAGAVARRLHDTGNRGWRVLLPLIFLMSGSYILPKAFIQADPQIVLLAFANNFLYLAALLFLLISLAREGSAGKNQYGAPT
jgi:uncharacterized membrane protein YhaH (DUF805 family)